MSALAFTAPPVEITDGGEFSLNEPQKILIRSSYQRMEPAAELIATLFFMRLFDQDESLRSQFKGPIKGHAKKLAELMKLSVLSLNQQQNFKPTLKLLGARFRQQGIGADAYSTMAQAMIWSFEKSLEKEFTYGTRRAWTVFLSQMTSVMAAG